MLKGLVCAVISACCYGTLPILGKLGYALGMETFEMLSYRFGLGAVILAIWIGLTDPRSLRIAPRSLLKAVALGTCIYPLQSTCFMSAIKYIPASTTTLILYFYPICVTVLSVLLFKMRVGRQVVLSLVMVTAGCALVFYDAFSQGVNSLGLAFAVGAMLIFSVYLIASQLILKNEPPLTVGLYVIISAAVVFTLLAGPPDLKAMTWPKAALALSFGLFPTVLAVGLLYTAINAVGSAYTSIFSTMEPVTTVILAYFVLGEPLALWQVAGAACIVAGITLPNLGLIRRKAAVTPAV
ncbi:MAG: DMT family transporter [Proteobacteria bacterium]|nr:DMT family transporter [Pseudomonadota bacterium]